MHEHVKRLVKVSENNLKCDYTFDSDYDRGWPFHSVDKMPNHGGKKGAKMSIQQSSISRSMICEQALFNVSNKALNANFLPRI